MTEYRIDKNIFYEFPYKFKTRVFGKWDEEFINNSPNNTIKDYSELADYDGLSCKVTKLNKINVGRRGNVTINDEGIASGFSTSNFLELPYTFTGADTFTVTMRFKANTISGTQHLFSSIAGTNGVYGGVTLTLQSNGKLLLQISTNGTSYVSTESTAITAGVWYKVQFGCSSGQFFQREYALTVQQEGGSTNYYTIAETGTLVNSTVTRIGVYGNNIKEPCTNCIIDLSKCNIFLNTATVWNGLSTVQGKKVDFSNTILPWKWDYNNTILNSIYAYVLGNTNLTYYDNSILGTINGTLYLDNNDVLRDFTTNNYYKSGYTFNPRNESWEIRIKFKTGNSVSNWQQIFQSCSGTGSSGRFGIILYIHSNSVFNFAISSNNSSWLFDTQGTYQLQTNTIYYVKIGWSGTEYYLEVSTDNNTYTRDITFQSTSPVYSNLVNTYFGIYSTNSFQNPFGGLIYINDTVFSHNNMYMLYNIYKTKTLQGCVVHNEYDFDPNDNYHCYIFDHNNSVALVASSAGIAQDAENPRYLGEVHIE